MRTLSIDIETYSSYDLIKGGVYKYIEAPDFEVLMLAYSWDDEDGHVELIDFYEDKIPKWVRKELKNKNTLKTAFNAPFEIPCLSKEFDMELPVDQWECTSVRAGMAGYPMSLAGAAKAIGLEQQKSTEGSALIRYFSIPCKPTKTNGGRTRNLPEHSPEKWERFKEYCKQDVVVENAIREHCLYYPITDFDRKLWILDQKINATGVKVNTDLIVNALQFNDEYTDKLRAEAIEITGLANPNSTAQLLSWMQLNGEELEDLKKATVKDAIEYVDNADVARVLEIRQEMAKTSIKKYIAMRHGVNADRRARGLFQFVGASRTHRWAGRRVQLQNLPQNKLRIDHKKGIDDLDVARKIVLEQNASVLQMIYGNVPDILSQLIRTAFEPESGSRFIISDFSAIEARIIAWLAGEEWRMKVFRTHGKIYEASASAMFKVPIETIAEGKENYALRQRGKVAELALGYQGAAGALITMGALKFGLTEDELPELVRLWREANPAIVALWRTFDNAAVSAIENPGQVFSTVKGIKFWHRNGNLNVKMPSGGVLVYVGAEIIFSEWKNTKVNTQGGDIYGGFHSDVQKSRTKRGIRYKGLDQITNQWSWVDTYGGKVTENIVQKIARDCLGVAMLRLNDAGYNLVIHVHDETVSEVPFGMGSLDEVNEIMGFPIPWAEGLPLQAKSFESSYYKKD